MAKSSMAPHPTAWGAVPRPTAAGDWHRPSGNQPRPIRAKPGPIRAKPGPMAREPGPMGREKDNRSGWRWEHRDRTPATTISAIVGLNLATSGAVMAIRRLQTAGRFKEKRAADAGQLLRETPGEGHSARRARGCCGVPISPVAAAADPLSEASPATRGTRTNDPTCTRNREQSFDRIRRKMDEDSDPQPIR